MGNKNVFTRASVTQVGVSVDDVMLSAHIHGTAEDDLL